MLTWRHSSDAIVWRGHMVKWTVGLDELLNTIIDGRLTENILTTFGLNFLDSQTKISQWTCDVDNEIFWGVTDSQE